MTPLYTIGYERASFASVAAALAAAGVRRVLDVRDLPLSRRPGFSKRGLAAGLGAAGIAYTHLRALGTPPEGREANRRRRWPEFCRIVEARLATEAAEHALAEAADLAEADPCCLLCYEADACRCHRLRVGELMAGRRGFALRHLAV